jgi:hypothetical protein
MTRHEPISRNCTEITPDRRALRNLRLWPTQCGAGPERIATRVRICEHVEIFVITHRRYWLASFQP